PDHCHLHSFPTRRSSDLADLVHRPDARDALKDAALLVVLDHRARLGLVDLEPLPHDLGRLVGARGRAHRSAAAIADPGDLRRTEDRKSTRLNSSHRTISY